MLGEKVSDQTLSTWGDDTRPDHRINAGMPSQPMTEKPSALLPKARRRGLNRLWPLRAVLVALRLAILRHVWGMDIHPTAQLSLKARLDRTFPKGVHIGARSYVAFDACILTHDRTRGLYTHTHIGRDCFIGARSIVLPGLRIGDGVIVGAGAVVTKDVPDRCAVAGNPAKVIRTGLNTDPYGRLADADATEARLARAGKT